MYNPVPGVYIEEGAWLVLLFWVGYVLLFVQLRRLIRERGMSRWILLEGLFLCLLADRFLALYSEECYRLTMEWEPYIRRWRCHVCLLSMQILAGAAVLHWCRTSRGRTIGFLCIVAAGVSVCCY